MTKDKAEDELGGRWGFNLTREDDFRSKSSEGVVFWRLVGWGIRNWSVWSIPGAEAWWRAVVQRTLVRLLKIKVDLPTGGIIKNVDIVHLFNARGYKIPADCQRSLLTSSIF